MALSLAGWINGITVTSIFIFGIIFGLFCIYKAKKANAKLLLYMGLFTVFNGLAYLGNFVDFLTIMLTSRNIDNSYGLLGILCVIWYGPAGLAMMFFTTELLIPQKKKYLNIFAIFVALIFEIFLVLDFSGTITYIYPSQPGENLIEDNVVVDSAAGVMYIIMLLFILVFWALGCIIKFIQSSGILRKKYLLLFLSILFYLVASIIEQVAIGFLIILGRIMFICFFLMIYIAVREEPEKKEKIRPKKEVKIEGGLFRISKRPDQITEEEVSISKEKKICLVCKGKVLGYNNFICPNCETFYCAKCAHALENLENACWVCNKAFNKSKPVKPFKREEEEIEISEKPQKKPKTKK